MLVFGRFRAFKCAPAIVVGFFAFLGGVFSAPARAAAPTYPDILPLRFVKAGMTGYGLTTFHGTTVSRFAVTIIGIIKNYRPGRDVILIRMKGGPITERGANLIEGMSGSPIYINNKVIGAFALGEEFPKEPVGMVTPIEDMLEAWDPNLPLKPSYYAPAEKNAPRTAEKKVQTGANVHPTDAPQTVALPRPIQVGSRRISRLVLALNPHNTLRSTEDTAVMRPATNLFTVSGITERDRVWLQKEFDQRGYAVTVTGGAAAGSVKTLKAPPLRPGSQFGTMVVTGDVISGATGTITYRRGNRILGFGHPFLGLGVLEGAVTTASVVDVFSSFVSSHVVSNVGPTIGTLRQDREFSVSGELGVPPPMVPFTITIHDETTHRDKTFRTLVFQHPDQTALLMRAIARVAVNRVHNVPGDVMARISTTVDAGEVGTITRHNLVFDADSIASSITQDLNDITNITSGNPFYPLPIKSGRMTVDIANGHNTATVERIFVPQGRYEPGDTLDVGVVIKPYRRDPVTRTISLKIPADTPTGRYQLNVRGGMPNVIRFGSLTLTSGAPDTQTPPVNVRQMVARLNEHERNTDLVARLVLNSVAPALEGEKLSQLPPTLSQLMRSDRNSGVRLERDEVRATAPTDYVVTGTQQLLVSVVRKNTQESPGGGSTFNGSSPGGSSSGLPPGFTGGSGTNGVNFNEDGMSVSRPISSEDHTLDSLRTDADPQESQPVENASEDTAFAPPPADGSKTDTAKQKKPTPKTKADSKTKAGPTTSNPPPAPTVSVSAPPIKPDESSSDKPVGRQMQTWRQTARADFGAGKFTGTSVTASGELRLAPSLRRLVSTTETYVWSLAADENGTLYAGTGTGGEILKIDSQGKATTFVTLPVLSIQSLLRSRDGSLWAGSGGKGSLYHITPDGASHLVSTLPEKYILALAEDSKGNLFIGPGGGGTVYKIGADAKNSGGNVTPQPFLKTSADHILALAVDAQDNLYIGTGNDGILYRAAPDGTSSVLYDAKENAITALAVDAGGVVYAGTGTKGLLYRIQPDGSATVLFDRASSFYTALRTAPDGSLYAATVNGLYHITPGKDADTPTVQALDNPKDVDFLSLAVLPNGNVAAGTGNIGEVYTSLPADAAHGAHSGVFESVVHDARLTSRWGMVRWVAQTPSGSHLRVETRTGNVAEPDSTWSGWTAAVPTGTGSEAKVASPPARFLQVRLLLDSDNDRVSPGVREISVGYMPRNQAPRVAFQSPGGGERWAKSQTIRWNGSDPDNDTLTYTLFYSTDAGATWKTLPDSGKSTAATTVDTKSVAVNVGETKATGSSDTLQKQLDADPSIPAQLKQILLDNDRQRHAGEGTGTTGGLRETSKTWDTRSLPDGTYWLKVVATDRVSNPTDALTAQAISDPFVISNALPRITILTRRTLENAKTVAIEGSVSQPLIAVTAVQYRVDGGDWTAALPKDGLFDSEQEGFAFVTTALSSGKHTLEIKAFNAAGNTAAEKLDVTVP